MALQSSNPGDAIISESFHIMPGFLSGGGLAYTQMHKKWFDHWKRKPLPAF
jgi:hypothetical protein